MTKTTTFAMIAATCILTAGSALAADYRPLRVHGHLPRYRHHAYDAGYRPEWLGTTPFGDRVYSGRMGLHRGGFDQMVLGNENDEPQFVFIGARGPRID